ncbi:MAG: MXAN_6640 family putative metalloprotease [Solirubrobacterales bacterium]
MRATATCLALVALALPASAAGAPGSGRAHSNRLVERARANRLVERARALLGETAAGARASEAGHRHGHLTPINVRLARALPSLSGGLRRRVASLLARPTDPMDPDGHSYPPAARSQVASDCTAHFCVHWVNSAAFADAPDLTDLSPANGVPDFVDQVEAVAEQVHATENGTLGWRAPRPDGTLGGNARTDIYLADVGETLFGYASPDPGQAGRRRHAYLVLDDDYSSAQFPGTTSITDIEVTLAHEYNHVLQFGYDTFQDLWMMESSATWMEDRVYGSVNDYLRYMSRWNDRFRIPLTRSSIKIYGSAVWNHWLAHRYGPDLIRTAWEDALGARPTAFSVASYGAAIEAAGASDFDRDFALFARDLAEWRVDTAFPEGDSYPDVARQGSLPTNGARRLRSLDHTTYRLLRVAPAPGRALKLTATVRSRASVAICLVGRIGSQTAGTVVSAFRMRRGPGSLAVGLPDPQRFDRITAVLVNADTAIAGVGALGWRYTGNDVRFVLRARLRR